MARTAAATLAGSLLQVVAGEPEGCEQAVDPDPGRERVVIAQLELGVFAGLGQPFEQAEPAGDLGQAAAAVVDPPRDHLEAQAGARLDRQSQHARVDGRAQGVDVVDQQPVAGWDTRPGAVPARRCRSRLGTS